MHRHLTLGIAAFCLLSTGCTPQEESLGACLASLTEVLQASPSDRAGRFQAKVREASARCRGGDTAVKRMNLPWVDWGNYFGTGDAANAPRRGVAGALVDLEKQRADLIRYNLFDNNGTYRTYILGGNKKQAGPVVRQWDEFHLPPEHPDYASVRGANREQKCTGELIRKRTLTGICNDIFNPLMGSTRQLFARNVEFESAFPELGTDEYARNRHAGRISLLRPDPQVISRRLFTRAQSSGADCRDGKGPRCDYQQANSFNVLAAFWIQFMTHDWFSHLEEGHNDSRWISTGCESARTDNVEKPLSAEEVAKLGCRPADRIDAGYVAESEPPATFTSDGRQYLSRAPRTMRNNTTAWWDASQIYGFDDVSVKRVRRDPADSAKLLLSPIPGQPGNYLPLLQHDDPMNPEWAGQEATAFPDNWNIGMSFLTTVFAREHNAFVDAFRKQTTATPDADSGLRNPAAPHRVIRFRDVTPEELYDVARLVVSAEIAKIHTIEWTPQLLYDEPLRIAMNANWSGLLGDRVPLLSRILQNLVAKELGASNNAALATRWYSVFASGPGIVGMGSGRRRWSLDKPKLVNGGVNHFGSPFNFPEEFVSVYRLHPLVPDVLEYRDLRGDPNRIAERVPVVETFRGKATAAMRLHGVANWGLTFGRQRVGALTLRNYPMFLQNLEMNRLQSDSKRIDLGALDLIRDREHGIPRFNEFRRQYGLRQLTSFDDFIDTRLAPGSKERLEQEDRVKTMREIYGQHVCSTAKIITVAQRNPDGSAINDCLGHANGTLVDNIEDLDTVVGYLAETVRPHGFAISETQFVVFILNASRRLFSDRFLTSSYRPEFYTTMGLNWVNNNGPGTAGRGSTPFKQVLLRTVPELSPELAFVRNAFDPWARDPGGSYSLGWKPRTGAETDEAFAPNLQ